MENKEKILENKIIDLENNYNNYVRNTTSDHNLLNEKLNN